MSTPSSTQKLNRLFRIPDLESRIQSSSKEVDHLRGLLLNEEKHTEPESCLDKRMLCELLKQAEKHLRDDIMELGKLNSEYPAATLSKTTPVYAQKRHFEEASSSYARKVAPRLSFYSHTSASAAASASAPLTGNKKAAATTGKVPEKQALASPSTKIEKPAATGEEKRKFRDVDSCVALVINVLSESRLMGLSALKAWQIEPSTKPILRFPRKLLTEGLGGMNNAHVKVSSRKLVEQKEDYNNLISVRHYFCEDPEQHAYLPSGPGLHGYRFWVEGLPLEFDVTKELVPLFCARGVCSAKWEYCGDYAIARYKMAAHRKEWMGIPSDHKNAWAKWFLEHKSSPPLMQKGVMVSKKFVTVEDVISFIDKGILNLEVWTYECQSFNFDLYNVLKNDFIELEEERKTKPSAWKDYWTGGLAMK